jgi:SAM-dependent methyltransferase
MTLNFGEDYYADVYRYSSGGSIHRHIEPIDLNAALPASVLDVGCGCGWLVEKLREKGVQAWGVEASDYALANTHGEHVVRGSFTAIPFDDDMFDVVFSYGVLQYVAEADLPAALAEAKRVGRRQYHRIDHAQGYWYEKYSLTNEPVSFWDKVFADNGFVNGWLE